MNETSKNTAVKLIEAAVTGSEGAIRAAVSDTVIWHTPPSTLPAYQGPHHGPEAVIALIAAGGAPFVPGSRRVRVERCLAEGDHVAVDWRQTATLADGTAYDDLLSCRSPQPWIQHQETNSAAGTDHRRQPKPGVRSPHWDPMARPDAAAATAP
ncbi:nuclear transport factor 2 family protein [Streptomyces sp. NPDC046984]|uniref:nuclear transport factor 2 family protein n=1 Tax=Streptomyces sp. NPDC046984 TaxID=3155138 RepID=UPI0033D934E9